MTRAGSPWVWFVVVGALSVGAMTGADAQSSDLDPESREHVAAMAAHHLCAGVFVVGRGHRRTAEQVLARDIARFPVFRWQDDFEYDVDTLTRQASVWGPGVVRRSARYHGDQGCTILPRGEVSVAFQPVPVPRKGPDPSRHPWPTGEVDAYHQPPEVDHRAVRRALDWAMRQDEYNTRSLVVAYKGKIIGERYAPGFSRNTPQISWSQGKSITAALIGVLIQEGELRLDASAPVPEWQQPGDPRNRITIAHLLHMSSGLDFVNLGLNAPKSWTRDNEHFRIYFDGIDVFAHAVDQPVDLPPDSLFRYRNSDPLTLGYITRRIVESRGEEYLVFPQRALFDRIGARDFVLEPDPWGNLILTGYDYGSAWDWVRFGLLHLWDGVWEGERILPEGWSAFVSTPAPGDATQGYGALFWLNRGGVMDRVPPDAYWSSGFMGQRTMVIPSRDVVIVRLGPSPLNVDDYLNEFTGRILDAIESP